MEVGEEVQVVDSLQRKVEQVEEKLVELGGKVMECKAGARSLEAVRKRVLDISWGHLLTLSFFGSLEKETTVKKAFERRFSKYSSYMRISTEFSCLR